MLCSSLWHHFSFCRCPGLKPDPGRQERGTKVRNACYRRPRGRKHLVAPMMHHHKRHAQPCRNVTVVDIEVAGSQKRSLCRLSTKMCPLLPASAPVLQQRLGYAEPTADFLHTFAPQWRASCGHPRLWRCSRAARRMNLTSPA